MSIPIFKTIMKHTKILLILKGQDPISKHHEINIYIYKKIVEMEQDEDISFEQANILSLWYTTQKWKLFFKQKPNDTLTTVFGIYAWPLWQSNIDTQYILNPHE